MHGVNALTSPACCPQSGQPELKHAASRVTKADLPWRVAAFGYPVDGDAMALRATLRTLMAAAPFASVVLIGRERAGVLFRAAFAAPPDAAWLAAVDAAFGLAGETLRATRTPAAASGAPSASPRAGSRRCAWPATPPRKDGCASTCWASATWPRCATSC